MKSSIAQGVNRGLTRAIVGGIATGLLALACAATGVAEQGPAQPPAPPQAGVGPQGGARSEGRHHEVRAFEMRFGGPDDAARILPPGAWWKDQDLARRLELTGDQQKRIEDSFLQNRITLIHMHASLEEEELLLAPMLDANPIDQSKALAQISKIADTRADLEKANAKMLLQIRGVLNQQQWTRLQQERPGMHQHIFVRTPDGPHSFAAPDPRAMRMQLDKLPPFDSAKLQAGVLADNQGRPATDVDTLRLQIRSAIRRRQVLLDGIPSSPAEDPIVPAPAP